MGRLRLAEIFNVVYRGGPELKPEQQIGTIKINDDVHNHSVYNVQSGDMRKTSLRAPEEIELTGPTEAAIRADSSFMIDVNMFCGAFKESFGFLDCNDDRCKSKFRYPLQQNIESEDGEGQLQFMYAIYDNAVEARIEIKLLTNGDFPIELYGVIAASNSLIERPEWTSMLFLKKPDDPVEVEPYKSFPLSRSIVAMPLDFELYLDIHLYAENGLDMFVDTVTFKAQTSDTSRQVVVGENCKMEVNVTWHR